MVERDGEFIGRRTGDTFRILLESLHTASEGRNVKLVCINLHRAKQISQQLQVMSFGVIVARKWYILSFPNGKTIELYGQSAFSADRLKGFRDYKILFE